MAYGKPKYEFHISKNDWLSSKMKWEGIIKSLQSRNVPELLEFFEFDCGFCDETERCWAGNEPNYSSNLGYCKPCPLSKNNICLMGGDDKRAYWKVASFVDNLEWESVVLEKCNKKTVDRVIKLSQRILDAIIAAKPARFRKEEK